MRVNPIHSKKSGTDVYHNNNKCPERNNIEDKNIQKGTGGLRLCNRCKKLNSESK
jgi:hypothetical protein